MKAKTIWLLIAAILIIFAAIVVGNRPEGDSPPTSNSDTNSQSPSIEAPPATSAPAPTASSPVTGQKPSTSTLTRPIGATRSHVAYVHDGDTLFLQPDGTHSRDDQIKVRLIGVDTPEIGDNAECFGYEARDYLRSLLPEGAEVWVMPDREEFDRYGRSLLYVWTMDDRSVNLDLVQNGYATALNIAPSNTYWKQFEAAEDAAYNARVGLWTACI